MDTAVSMFVEICRYAFPFAFIFALGERLASMFLNMALGRRRYLD